MISSERGQRGQYEIDTNPQRLDVERIHEFLSKETYWVTGRPIEVVRRSIENSLPFGIYCANEQVGFARVITDFATFAWIADVFVLPEHRGQGLSKWLMQVILSHPQLQGFRRWVLGTRDAQQLYSKFGFAPLKRPERWMERPGDDVIEKPDYWDSHELAGKPVE
jgi:GNAT superfamily N-acetyltransferase